MMKCKKCDGDGERIVTKFKEAFGAFVGTTACKYCHTITKYWGRFVNKKGE